MVSLPVPIIIPIAPDRGLIYDRNGVLLAENRQVNALVATPSKSDDIKKAYDEINGMLGLGLDENDKPWLTPEKADYLSLNGVWKFKFVPEPSQRPGKEDFYADNADTDGWDEIEVPSCWEMKGYDLYF